MLKLRPARETEFKVRYDSDDHSMNSRRLQRLQPGEPVETVDVVFLRELEKASALDGGRSRPRHRVLPMYFHTYSSRKGVRKLYDTLPDTG